MVCNRQGIWFPAVPPGRNEHVGVGEVGFSEYGVGEHGDAVGCLDPGGFFDRYGFDVDSGAAKKVYYG